MNLFRLALATGTLASAFALSAQDVRFGLQAQVGVPMGDLKDAVDSKAGLGLGAHLTWDFKPQMQLRGRVDYMAFPNVTVDNVDSKVSNFSFGADYLYFIEGSKGVYLTGGLSLNRWEVDLGPFNASTTRTGVALGAGFAFNEHVSAEARFVMSSFNADADANLLQLGVLYRF